METQSETPCLNCHKEITEGLAREGVSKRPEKNLHKPIALVLRTSAVLLESLAASYRKWGACWKINRRANESRYLRSSTYRADREKAHKTTKRVLIANCGRKSNSLRSLGQTEVFSQSVPCTTAQLKNIGINYLIGKKLIWFAGPDIIASILLTGRVPHIERAIRVVPLEKQADLGTLSLRGMVEVSAKTGSLFKHVIEQRDPEAKNLGPDGELCNPETRGLLQRAHIVANWPLIAIGKEFDKHLEEGEDLSLLEFQTIQCRPRGNAVANDEQLARIAKVPKREFMRRGISQHHARENL